ncbi:MAG: pantoate--beta-alanine ligase [Thermoanaerobaculia bacterium]
MLDSTAGAVSKNDSLRSVTTASDLWAALAAWRSTGLRIGFVPTMGALHAGHLALVGTARSRTDRVVVSIFVNPKQFGPAEDFERYPRDLAADRARLEEAGADLLFAPTVDEMYPPGFATSVHVAGVSEGMEGARRPGHFDGVATVVARLFGLVRPDVSVFGAKDGQQAAVIRRLARDLGFPMEVIVAETVREPDGLAMSSRNAFLTPAERLCAPGLFRALLAARLVYELGERKGRSILGLARTAIEAEPAFRLDALDLVDAESMQPVQSVERPVMLAAAVFLGKTRLIDNIRFG